MSVWLGMTSPECVCSSCKYPKKRTNEAHISYSITVSQLSMAESIAQAAQTLGTTAPALAFFLAQSRDTGLSTKLHSYTRASCLQVESSLWQPDADFWLSLIGITPHGMNRRLQLSASLVLPAPVTLQHGKCDVSLVEQLPRSLHADEFESQRLSLPGGAHSLSFLPKCEHPNTLMASFFFFPTRLTCADTHVFGDQTEDAPAFTSNESLIIQRFQSVSAKISSPGNAVLSLDADLPLHARYPPPKLNKCGSHMDIPVGFPVAAAKCSWQSNGARPTLVPCSNCADGNGSTTWSVPRGCVDDCLVVTTVTTLLHVLCAALIALIVLRPFRRRKEE